MYSQADLCKSRVFLALKKRFVERCFCTFKKPGSIIALKSGVAKLRTVLAQLL